MNVPKLKFKEFNDEYKQKDLSEISVMIKDGTHGTHENYQEGIPLLSAKDINNNKINIPEDCRKISIKDFNKIYKNYSLIENDILLTIVGTIGRAALYKNEKVAFQRSVALIRIDNNNNSNYIKQYIESPKILNQLNNMTNSSAQGGVYLSSLSKLKFVLPTKKEQIKVSNFLSLLDKKIELQTKKIEDLKLFKLELKERLFKMPETEKKELSDILIKWNKKNKDNKYNYVESVSNKYGFIAQNEQFEDRSVASNDTKNYYVIEKGVFAYNPSRLNVGSLALKENDKVSLVSPLYECFTTNQNKSFLYEWFNSKEFKKGTVSKFEGGVRNTLNFSNLCKIKISLPSIEEQNKIANLLNLYNSLINLENRKLTKLNELKKGLMQDMFV